MEEGRESRKTPTTALRPDDKQLVKKAVALVNAVCVATSQQDGMIRHRHSGKVRRRHSEDKIEISQVLSLETRISPINGRQQHYLDLTKTSLDGYLTSSPWKNTEKKRRPRPRPPLERHMTLAIISLDPTHLVKGTTAATNNTVWSRHHYAEAGLKQRRSKSGRLYPSGTEDLSYDRAEADPRPSIVAAEDGHDETFFAVTPTTPTAPAPSPFTVPAPVPPVDDALEPPGDASRQGCRCGPWTCLQDRPLLKLVLVMILNALISMACAAAIIEIEWPQQRVSPPPDPLMPV